MSSPSLAAEDFVSSDVNEALQEARLIVTQGKGRPPQAHEHVIEESTTVQVNKSGTKNDPVQVIITKSTIFTQDSEDEEEISGSLSDSDLQIRRRTESAHSIPSSHHYGSDTDIAATSVRSSRREKSHKKHTNARYRKKKNEFWTKDDGKCLLHSEGTASDFDEDQACLEVDVKEECREEDGEGHVLIKTWEARWTVQHYDLLPEWLQDNEYLRTGHRPPLPSVVECFKSILSLHTETGNIWTHLIGCVAFFLLALWFLTRPDTHIGFQEKLVFSFFFGGAILCLGLSFAFHTLSCHSVHVLLLFSKLDYMGISLLIVGSFIPWVYYGFYCRREPKITYIAMVSVLGVGAIIVSLWDKFSESRYRPLRAGVFVSMGMSGIVPAIHFVYTDGMRRLIDENGFYWLMAMASLYLVGAILYATRTPERFFPGKFDIWMEPFDKPVFNGRVFGNPRSFLNWKGLPGYRAALKWMLLEKSDFKIPKQSVLERSLPVIQPTFDLTSKLSATWLGHSTVFVHLDGISFITDPVWSSRASPFSFIGPIRYRPPPCAIEDLPQLHFAVISHNHYDHLDADAVSTLSAKFPDMEWFVPKGLSDWMRTRAANNVVHEMTWGEHITLALGDGKYQIWCLPAQHWSLRHLLDRNRSLWCGWAVVGPERKFYYSGDTGFCDNEFAKIGSNLGPFDLAAIPIGAYSPRWIMKSQHIDPAEAVKTHQLVKAVRTLGIHWGTYDMGSNEGYLEPRSRLRQEVENAGLKSDVVFTVDHGGTWTEDPSDRYHSASQLSESSTTN